MPPLFGGGLNRIYTRNRTRIGDLARCKASTNAEHHNQTTAETLSWTERVWNPRLQKSVYGLDRTTTVIGQITLRRILTCYVKNSFGELGIFYVYGSVHHNIFYEITNRCIHMQSILFHC